MQKHALKQCIVSYSAAISACEKGGQDKKALRLFAAISENDLQPNIVSYNAVLDAVHGRIEGKQIFQRALDAGVYPGLLAKGQNVLDLHDLSPGAARLAIDWWTTCVIPCLLQSKERIMKLEMITGWGRSRKAWGKDL
eukprot:gnl/MRDRNA2_/MRDRNA2_20772_c0_seq1.p1 gnl/MRDRNA2_/MRDRNA2_20772_c0~~gnl/MRDRNA2_/MRDRNA2_20772_c0_seq1.p1  ORF type:complete len:138 (-),score=30.65 gnl/MRDRNA2_/MRDRNA2_20772_c0_seq1:24-437(-)